jgi:hypothetical protein
MYHVFVLETDDSLTAFDYFLNKLSEINSNEMLDMKLLLSTEDESNILTVVETLQNMIFRCNISKEKIDQKTHRQLYTSFSEIYQPHITSSYGNCLWNMISISLCGNESLTILLRKLTFFTMLFLKNDFLEVLRKEVVHLKSDANNNIIYHINTEKEIRLKLQDILLTARADTKWGNEYHLLALSTFLNKNICVYSGFLLRDGNLQHVKDIPKDFLSQNFDKIGHNLIYKPIENNLFKCSSQQELFGFFRGNNHYVALIPISNEILFLPKKNLFDFPSVV